MKIFGPLLGLVGAGAIIAGAWYGRVYAPTIIIPTSVTENIQLPNEVTPEFIAGLKIDYEARVSQVAQAIDFASKTLTGEDRTRIITEAVKSGVECQKSAVSYNAAVKDFKGAFDRAFLDPANCTEGIEDRTKGPAVKGDRIIIEDSSIARMREESSQYLQQAEGQKNGVDRQVLIIKATALMNECRAIAVRKSIDPKQCVPNT